MLKIPTAVTSLPFRNSTAEQELIFRATIPPLGFISFYVSRTSEESPVPTPLADDQKFRLTSNASFKLLPFLNQFKQQFLT